LAEPLNIPPDMIKTPDELLDLAESLSLFDAVAEGAISLSQWGPGTLAGIMQAFQDAAESDCDCDPCITLREIIRKMMTVG
jgi:hypothetical protein